MGQPFVLCPIYRCFFFQFSLQFSVCITTFLVQKYLISTTTVRLSRQFCSHRSSRHVVCIIQIHMPCRLLVLHAPLYTNIVDRKSGPFGGNLDKNAKNWLEQGALAIFWRFLTPGNKWCLDWSWFQTIYPIPIFDILFPFPVTKSQSQWLKSHFPRAKTGQSQFPFYPFRTLRAVSVLYLIAGYNLTVA